MEVSRAGISRRKVKLLLIYFLVVSHFTPAHSQRPRRRFRLISALTGGGSEESREVSSQTPSQGVRINIYQEVLDRDTGLTLTWSVNRNLGAVTFTIESQRRSGYVVLALTKEGLIQGCDVIVVGVREADGTPYIIDMHGTDNDKIVRDQSQDWRLDLDDSKSEGGMRITIRRNLDSCDGDDMAIGNEKISLAYSQGEGDTAPTQLTPKGIKEIAFIGPEADALPASNCSQKGLSPSASPASMAGDTSETSESENLRIIRTANPLEDELSSGTLSSTVGPDGSDDVKEPRVADLEERSIEYQDPADDRYGHAHVKVFPFYPWAYARLRMKLLLGKMKMYHKHMLKFAKF